MSEVSTPHGAEEDFQRAFRGVAGQFACGVTLVISLAGDTAQAATATAFVPVSLDPPLVALFFATGSRMAAHLHQGCRWTVNILAEEDHTLARHFGRSARVAGWEGLASVELLRRDPAPPALARALAWLDCSLWREVVMGDHICFVGQVLEMNRRQDAAPLVTYRGRFARLGPALAPAPWSVFDPADEVASW